MNSNILNKLYYLIEKFDNKSYGTNEFHSSIDSLINLITEAHHHELRERLLKFESELEYIDFMVDETRKRESYSIKINELIKYLE
jgi:hypothetical protein